MTGTDILLLSVAAIVILPIVLVGIAMRINSFTKELRYLNIEISRTTGEQRQHWLRLRRRLWLSLIPFVRY